MSIRTKRLSTGLYLTSTGFRLESFKNFQGLPFWLLKDPEGRRVGEFPRKRDALNCANHIYKAELTKARVLAGEAVAARLAEARAKSYCETHGLPREANFGGKCIQCMRDMTSRDTSRRYIKDLEAEKAKIEKGPEIIDDDVDDDYDDEYPDDDDDET